MGRGLGSASFEERFEYLATDESAPAGSQTFESPGLYPEPHGLFRDIRDFGHFRDTKQVSRFGLHDCAHPTATKKKGHMTPWAPKESIDLVGGLCCELLAAAMDATPQGLKGALVATVVDNFRDVFRREWVLQTDAKV